MRVIKKEYKILAICILACMIFVSVLGSQRTAQAAGRVDTEKKGVLTLALGMEDSAQMAWDIPCIEEPVQVRLWKLADMQESGSYEFGTDFQELAGDGEDWKSLAENALALVYELDETGKPYGEPKIAPDHTADFKVTESGNLIGNGNLEEQVGQANAGEIRELELGLYLVVPETVNSPKYEYAFNPMIVSLPWSEYQYVGGDASDEWQYEREVTLKPARTLRYGGVKIQKTLTSYNASQGDVTFVFDVTATDSESGETVYSNVVSATFTAAGMQELILEHIPAEAQVTVREVYSGANCQITVSDDEVKSVIAEEMDGGGETVTFRFENEYDEELKSGYGVENRFRYDTVSESYVHH